MLPRNLRRRSRSRQRSGSGIHLPAINWKRLEKLVVLVLVTWSIYMLPQYDATWQTTLVRTATVCIGSWSACQLLKVFSELFDGRKDIAVVRVDESAQTDQSNEAFVIDARKKERAFQREIRRLRRRMFTLRKQCSKQCTEQNDILAKVTQDLSVFDAKYRPLQEEMVKLKTKKCMLEEYLFVEEEKHREILKRYDNLETDITKDKPTQMPQAIEDELIKFYEGGDAQVTLAKRMETNQKEHEENVKKCNKVLGHGDEKQENN